MKKIIITLLAVMLCCCTVFAHGTKIDTALTLSATFGFDENTKIKFNEAEAALSLSIELKGYQQVYDADGRPVGGVVVDRDGDGKIDPYGDGGYSFHNMVARVGYRYFSNEAWLASFYAEDDSLEESGFFADFEYYYDYYIDLKTSVGYRLFPVVVSENEEGEEFYSLSTKDGYKGIMDNTYLDKGFYFTSAAEVKTYYGFTFTGKVLTDLKDNEVNITKGSFTANYEPTFLEADVDLTAGLVIFTDKSSNGELLPTSTRTFGRASYSYNDKYIFSSVGTYFTSYTDKAVEDGLYTRSTFTWNAMNDEWFRDIVGEVVKDSEGKDTYKSCVDSFNLTTAVTAWLPEENGKLELAKITTDVGLDAAFYSGKFAFDFDSYYNHFIGNKEEDYLYGEYLMNLNAYSDNDWDWSINYENSILINKVAGKLNVPEAQYCLNNLVQYKGAEWNFDVDYMHSQDNDPEKNRVITNFEAGYSFPADDISKVYMLNAEVFAGFNAKYYKLNNGFSKGEYDGYTGSAVQF